MLVAVKVMGMSGLLLVSVVLVVYGEGSPKYARWPLPDIS